jgi:deoxyribonuclease IV
MPPMQPDGRRVGAHLPLGTGMVRAADRAHEIGADCLQVFADNPTAWRRRAEPPTELVAFRERLGAYDIRPVALHAAYLVNLAGPDPAFFAASVDLLAGELEVAPTFGASLVNVHIGSHRGTSVDEGVERVADGVAATFERVAPRPDPVRLVLENSAGSGWGLGVDIHELAAIATAIDARGVPRDRVGFCLDTAHAWGAGIDVGSPAAVDAFLADFDARIGLDRLALVHVNDSRSALGSRLDRHEHVGAGRIGADGLGHLVRHPALARAAFVVETPGMDEGFDAVNVGRVRDLLAGRPLPALPPEAFDLRGSARARTAPA